MKKSIVLFTALLMFFTSTALAKYSEHVISRITGKIGRSSIISANTNKDFSVDIFFSSDSGSKHLNYYLTFCFMPTDEKLNPFPIYLNRSPLIGYSTKGTTSDYKQTLFSKTLNAIRSSSYDGWEVCKDNVIRPHFSSSSDYFPASIGIKYDGNYADPTNRVNKKMQKQNEYWETQKKFTQRLLNNIRDGNGMTFYIAYFKSNMDAVQTKNGHQLQLTLDPSVLQEWKKVLVNNGYL